MLDRCSCPIDSFPWPLPALSCSVQGLFPSPSVKPNAFLVCSPCSHPINFFLSAVSFCSLDSMKTSHLKMPPKDCICTSTQYFYVLYSYTVHTVEGNKVASSSFLLCFSISSAMRCSKGKDWIGFSGCGQVLCFLTDYSWYRGASASCLDSWELYAAGGGQTANGIFQAASVPPPPPFLQALFWRSKFITKETKRFLYKWKRKWRPAHVTTRPSDSQ